ncbi:hypothetical protein [Bilophila wadsworthia]|uniref:hypothetical protein n=1 Tax=Bilophila wadsworthia TaxID=35833 RepID=UPI00242C5060|nr:hypothetical protein [Bilophila wadsworthia]
MKDNRAHFLGARLSPYFAGESMNRRLRSMLMILTGVCLGLVAAGWLILGQAKFGKAPEGY